MKILVTGATGHLGSAVVQALLKGMPAADVAMLARKPEQVQEQMKKGFDARLGDYDSPDLLEKATQGIHTALLISAGDQGDRMQQHKNVVDAAKKAGVECIAYTSRSLRHPEALANKLMTEHFQTEDYIKQSGLKYTFFRNALYMDVLPLFVGGKAVFERGIQLPAGDGKVAYALRAEQGKAIGNVLLRGECANKTYQFTGDKAYSFDDVAKALSELSGKEVKYAPTKDDAFIQRMTAGGMPAPAAEKVLAFNVDIRNGQEDEVTGELEQALSRKPTGLKEGLKGLFNL